MNRSSLPLIGRNLLVAIVYFAGAELGLSLATLHQNVTPVWPPVAAQSRSSGLIWNGRMDRARASMVGWDWDWRSYAISSSFAVALCLLQIAERLVALF